MYDLTPFWTEPLRKAAKFNYFRSMFRKRPIVLNSEQAYNKLKSNWPDLDVQAGIKIIMLDKKFRVVSVVSLTASGEVFPTWYPYTFYFTPPSCRAQHLILAYNVLSNDSKEMQELHKQFRDKMVLSGKFIDCLEITSCSYSSTWSGLYSYPDVVKAMREERVSARRPLTTINLEIILN